MGRWRLGAPLMTIVPFLGNNVFDPSDIRAMSTALDDVCKILHVADAAEEKSASRRRLSPSPARASATLRSCGTAC